MAADIEPKIRHGTCADPYHDFHKKSLFNTNKTYQAGKPGLYEAKIGLPPGLPIPDSMGEGGVNGLHKENQMLQLLFGGTKISESYTVPTDEANSETLMKNLFDAIDELADKRKEISITTLFGMVPYTIRLLKDTVGNTNINQTRFKVAKPARTKQGRAIPATLQRDGTLTTQNMIDFIGGVPEINILFDACSIDITAMFKYGKKMLGAEPPLKVNWLINREFINDPATKPYFANPTKHPLEVQGASVINRNNIHYLVEDENETIIYSRHGLPDDNDKFMRNRFYSLYDFKLGPTKMTEGSIPTAQLEILDNKRQVHKSSDPKSDNQIGSCCRRILDYIASKIFDRTNMIAVNYQAKRSGDWLQALCCLDVERKYRNVSAREGSGKPLRVKNIVLVTHDRILLFYAILLGIDVIFVGGASGVDNTGSEEEEEEEEDEGAAAPDKKLYTVYFANNNRRMSEADVQAYKQSIITSMFAGAPNKYDTLLGKIGEFNIILNIIKSSRLASIQLKKNIILESKTAKGLEQIKALLIEFVRYASLDYTEINIAALTALRSAYDTAPSTNPEEIKKKIELGMQLYAKYNILEIKTKLCTIESIETSGTFGSNAKMFNVPLPPFHTPLIQKKSRVAVFLYGGAARELQSRNMEILSIGICDILDPEMLNVLKNIIDEIKVKIADFETTPLFNLLQHINLRQGPSTAATATAIIEDVNILHNLNTLIQEQSKVIIIKEEADLNLIRRTAEEEQRRELEAAAAAASGAAAEPKLSVEDREAVAAADAIASAAIDKERTKASVIQVLAEGAEGAEGADAAALAHAHAYAQSKASSDLSDIVTEARSIAGAKVAEAASPGEDADVESLRGASADILRKTEAADVKREDLTIEGLKRAKQEYYEAEQNFNKLTLELEPHLEYLNWSKARAKGVSAKITAAKKFKNGLDAAATELKLKEAKYQLIRSSMNDAAVEADEQVELAVDSYAPSVVEAARAAAGAGAAGAGAAAAVGAAGAGEAKATIFKKMRSRLYTIISILPTRRLLGRLITAVIPFNRGGGAAAHGGGGELHDMWAHFLFISYVSEVLSALNGFESAENLDYQYYDGLSRLVIAYIQSVEDKRDFKPMAQFLYNTIPTCEWKSRGNFGFYTSYVAHCTSLNAVGVIEGDLPDFGYSASLTETTVKNYETITEMMRGKTFSDRQYFLQLNLWNIMNLPFDSTFDPPAMQSVAAPIIATVGNTGQNKGFGFHLNLPKRNTLKKKNQMNNPKQFQGVFSTLTPQQKTLFDRKVGTLRTSRPLSLLGTRINQPMLASAAAGGKRRTFKKKKLRNKTRKNRNY